MDRPLIDLSPDHPDSTYRRWGRIVAEESLRILHRERPDIWTLTREDRAYIAAAFREDLDNIETYIQSHVCSGSRLLWRYMWLHPAAGAVVALAFAAPPGMSTTEFMMKRLGASRA